MTIPKERLVDMYRTMLRIRAFEEKVVKEFRTGKIPSVVHLSQGQEAISTGACANLNPDELEQLDADDHMRIFVGFVASLMDDYARYLEGSQRIDLVADGVGYRKTIMHLTLEELMEMSRALNLALKPFLALPPSPDRQPRLFSTVLMPDLPAEESSEQ